GGRSQGLARSLPCTGKPALKLRRRPDVRAMAATLAGGVMTGEQVPARSLEAGDVIRIQHQHDSQCGECLSHWEAEAVVTEHPAPVGGGLAIKWAGDTRLPG